MTGKADPAKKKLATIGVLEGLGAYLWWGVVTTLYFRVMDAADPLELVTWRVLAGLPVIFLVIYIRGEIGSLRMILRDRRATFALLISALMILINWFTFIYSVVNERIIEASLGYYINPLVSVALGALFLGERLRPLQWLAVLIAAGAVWQLTSTVGYLPWISLVLAVSFGLYGLVRKQVKASAEVGLCVEMMLLFAPLLVLQLWLTFEERTLFANDFSITVGLVLGGIVTVIPLTLFARSARKVRLSTVGLLQYLAPTTQVCVAVWIVGEEIGDRWITLCLIAVAVLIYSADSLRAQEKRTLRS